MMRVTRRALAVAGTFASLSFATSPAFAQTGDEAAVGKAIEDLNKAMLAADKAALEALLADRLSYGHSAGRIETKADFLDVVAGRKTLYKSIVLSEPSVAVVGNNAIARHTMTVDTESGGKPATAKVGVMQVWVKDGGSWKLLARQAFRV